MRGGRDHALLQRERQFVARMDGVRVVDDMPIGALHHRISAIQRGLRAQRRQ